VGGGTEGDEREVLVGVKCEARPTINLIPTRPEIFDSARKFTITRGRLGINIMIRIRIPSNSLPEFDTIRAGCCE
jgi:hypothetical protein